MSSPGEHVPNRLRVAEPAEQGPESSVRSARVYSGSIMSNSPILAPAAATAWTHLSGALSAALCGGDGGAVAKQREGEVVFIQEQCACRKKKTHLTQPLPPQRAGGEGHEAERRCVHPVALRGRSFRGATTFANKFTASEQGPESSLRTDRAYLAVHGTHRTPAGARSQGRGTRSEPSSPHNRKEQPNIRPHIFRLFKALPARNRQQIRTLPLRAIAALGAGSAPSRRVCPGACGDERHSVASLESAESLC